MATSSHPLMNGFNFRSRLQEAFLALLAASSVLSLTSSSPSPPSLFSLAPSESPRLAVATTSGTFLGTSSSSIALESWLGVAYAQPPVGSLRFKAPLPITQPKSGTQDASSFGDACPQPGNSKMGEDCLFLNIWRPQNTTADSKLPILFWIHGGAFMTGSGSGSDPTDLIKYAVKIKKPIIFVATNYRLNTFGFLASANVPTSDLNAGLLDQRMALSWVQDNIAAFGGDPGKVTIWGQSAGAGGVESHLIYPPADRKNLFRAAMGDSPTGPFKNSPPASTYDRPGMPFSRLLASAGCKPGGAAVDCLRKVPYQTLLTISNGMIGSTLNQQLWQPAVGVGGGMITEEASTKIRRGDVLDVPWLGGTNLNEGTSFASSVRNLKLSSTAQQDTAFTDYIKKLFIDNSTIAASTISAFLSLYPPTPSSSSPSSTKGPFDFSTGDSLFDRAAEWYTDVMFLAPRRLFVQNLVQPQSPSPASTRRKSPLWTYHFREYIPGNDLSVGVTHSSELQLLFGPLSGQAVAEVDLSNQMRDAWLGFVVDGTPKSDQWIPYSSQNARVLQLARGNVTMISDDFNKAQTDFINSPEVLEQLQK